MTIKFHENVRVIISDSGLRGLRGEVGPAGGGGGGLQLLGPDITYTQGIVSRIDYDGGEFKLFTYSDDETLLSIQLTVLGVTTTKTLNYDDEGDLTSITQS